MMRRAQQTALLILLSSLAAMCIDNFAGGSPLRIFSGVLFLVILPWYAASRLPPLRRNDVVGGRLAASAALALAAVVLLGLLLTGTSGGITTRGITVGMLAITITLALFGVSGERIRPATIKDGLSPIGLAVSVAALAIAVFAFMVARDRALTQAHQETPYSAFLLDKGHRLDVGLRNPTDADAVFRVRDVGRQLHPEATVVVPARSVRLVHDFAVQPPSLRPKLRLKPKVDHPAVIRVTVTVNGRDAGPSMLLSTYRR
jgi:hypothetical protein